MKGEIVVKIAAKKLKKKNKDQVAIDLAKISRVVLDKNPTKEEKELFKRLARADSNMDIEEGY